MLLDWLICLQWESLKSRLSVKMDWRISPSDCMLLEDSAGWDCSEQNRIDSVLLFFSSTSGAFSLHFSFVAAAFWQDEHGPFLNEYVEYGGSSGLDVVGGDSSLLALATARRILNRSVYRDAEN